MIRNKKFKAEAEKTKVEQRVAKLSTPELSSWAEQALYAIGRSITDWDKTKEYYYLEEAATGAEALNAVVSELKSRQDKTRNF